ncbi:SWIM zinc finger family protein [Methanobrevibacter sp.]
MKAWTQTFDVTDLDEGIELSYNVKIIRNDGNQIIAQIENYEVTTYIQYNNPTDTSCTCSKTQPCKHEAALIYYLINHPELYVKKLDFDKIFNNVDEENLKKFLLSEFESDTELKTRFINQFKDNSINQNYYRNKLEKVFETGEGQYYDQHEIYDLDLMENSLYDFIFEDITTILSAGEYDFAWELLCKIAELLNDELMTTFDSWYDLTDRFMEHVHVLSTSIYLDAEKMDILYSKMDFIFEII